jgi:two-component system, chemotaxis family, protein-glutamate methylesterase/glutaminase
MHGSPVRRTAIPVVAVGGSAGSIGSFLRIARALPQDLPAAVVVALHLPRRARYVSQLVDILRRESSVPVRWARSGDSVRHGGIFVAPQDCTTTLSVFGRLVVEPGTGTCCPAIDPLFKSVAAYSGQESIAVVLSGALDDGAAGARAIERAGGIVIAQDRESSLCFSMPASAIATRAVHHVMPVRHIAAVLIAMLMARGARAWLSVEPDSAYQTAVGD